MHLPFIRRILLAYVLLTAIVSGVFSLSIVAIVHLVEEHLVANDMLRDLNTALQEDIALKQQPRLDAHSQLFTTLDARYALPEAYAQLPEGFSEVFEPDRAFYAYTLLRNGQRHVLLQQQDEFEQREQALFNIVLAGFIVTLILAWALGWLMARQVMRPVSRLADDVRQLRPGQSPLHALQRHYSADEIGELARAFDTTLAQLQDALQREQWFTSDVSHELRTPLMVIGSSCELLEQSDLQPAQRNQLARIQRASQSMQELVHTFLQLARDPRHALANRRATLGVVAQEHVEHWRQAMLDKGLDFSLSGHAAADSHYDASLLGTVLNNLLRNAWHYTESGHVRLELHEHGFAVHDSGGGITAEEQAQLFEPFVRGRHARGEGLGLGLALVKRICEREGWQIEVSSQPQQGSCFSVRLKS